MKAVSGKRFAKLLEQHKWELEKVGLQRSLMKLAGIEESEL